MPPPLDASEYQRWRDQATDTLATAGDLSTGDHHAWACFLAEQAAQFAAKGLLHAIGAQAWGHDLVILVNRTVEATGSGPLGAVADEAGRLSRHYIPARYPDAHPDGLPGAHYGASDAEQALADCRAVLAAIDVAWLELGAAG